MRKSGALGWNSFEIIVFMMEQYKTDQKTWGRHHYSFRASSRSLKKKNERSSGRHHHSHMRVVGERGRAGSDGARARLCGSAEPGESPSLKNTHKARSRRSEK